MKHLYKNIKIVAVLILVIITTNACSKDFLEVEIKGDLIAESTSDYNSLLNLRTLHQAFTPAIFALSPEVCMLEPFNAPANGSLELLPAFKWSGDIYRPDEDMKEVGSLVKNLYTFNKIIKEVLNSTGGSESEKLELEAQAKVNRAWTYFQLVNYFGKPYDATTSTTDPGFPIITQSDITETDFTRASVQEVYDFILQDLNDAIPNLPVAFSRIRMSKSAGIAFLGKIHVFMGNYSDGLTTINDAFVAFSSSPLETGLNDYNVTTLPGGPQGPGFIGPNVFEVADDPENPFVRSITSIDSFFSAELLISPELLALYGPTDIRLTTFYVNSPGPFSPPFELPNFMRRVGDLFAPFGVNIPDLYFLRAECKTRLNDLSGAIDDLEFFRQHRMPMADVPVPDGLSQNDLLFFIMDERMREFAVRGLEWHTTRRLSTDPLFSGRTYTHTLYNADGSIKETFTLTPERLALRFNEKLINQNPGFVNNP